jgi:hypothetical protein
MLRVLKPAIASRLSAVICSAAMLFQPRAEMDATCSADSAAIWLALKACQSLLVSPAIVVGDNRAICSGVRLVMEDIGNSEIQKIRSSFAFLVR